MQKNQSVQLDIESVGINGEGVARPGGVVVFVKGALPGERVNAKIIGVKKNYCYAILDRESPFVSTQSEMRVNPPCPLFGKCGGCNIMHVNYDEQLRIKRGLVRDTLKKVGGVDAEVLPTVPSALPLRYRNKMSLPVREENGSLKIGLFAAASHRVVETEDCLLQPEWNGEIIRALKVFMIGSKIKGYDESSGNGTVRHLVVREVENHLYITVVVTKKIPLNDFAALLKGKVGNFSLWLNVNKRRDNVILGDKWLKVYGDNESGEVEGLKAEIHPAGFFQVNDRIRSEIYAAVQDKITEIQPDFVIDAYSGAGIMTAMLAKRCKSITGIEINEQASQSAEKLIRDNNITNMRAICGDVADHIGAVTRSYEGKSVTVVLDPPRSGCDKSVLEAIISSGAENIIYVSCAPSTLARDLGILSPHYEVDSVRPYDMFPQTMNVETLVCLSHKKA